MDNPSRDKSTLPIHVVSLTKEGPPLPPEGGTIVTAAGSMIRFANNQDFSFAAYVEFKKTRARHCRGNHYHAEKTETLFIIRGLLEATYVDMLSGDRQVLRLTAGDLVQVPPLCAHVYKPLEHSEAIELASHPYDPSDTIAFAIT